MSEERSKSNLWAAIREAQKRLESIAKNRTSGSGDGEFSYPYVSADAMVHECRTALIECGLTYSMTHVSEIIEKRMTHLVYDKFSKSSVEMPICWLLATHMVTHVESGEMYAWNTSQAAVCTRGRPIDKAFVAAGTVATREALRFLLNVPRRTDDEPEQRDDSDYGRSDEPTRAPAQRQRSASAAPAAKEEPKTQQPPREFTDAELRHTKNVSSEDVWDVGIVREAKMSTGEKDGKPWTRYAITLDATDGQLVCSTFDKDLGTAAARWRAKGTQCSFATRKRGKFHDLTGIEPIDDRPPAPDPEITKAVTSTATAKKATTLDEDLPF